MSKLPVDPVTGKVVTLAAEWSAPVEEYLASLKDGELERAQDGIIEFVHCRVYGAQPPEVWADNIIGWAKAKVEGRPRPALSPGLWFGSEPLQGFTAMDYLLPELGVTGTPYQWIMLFEEMVNAPIPEPYLPAIKSALAQGEERLRVLARFEGPRLYGEGLKLGALRWRTPAEIRAWFWPRLAERILATVLPVPRPQRPKPPPRPRRRRSPRPVPEEMPSTERPVWQPGIGEDTEERRIHAIERLTAFLGALERTPALMAFYMEFCRQWPNFEGRISDVDAARRAACRAVAAVLKLPDTTAWQQWGRIMKVANKQARGDGTTRKR